MFTAYFIGGAGAELNLDWTLRSWLSSRPLWALREVPGAGSDPSFLPWLFPAGHQARRAVAREVAEELLLDPKVEGALRALESPVGQHIEYAVMAQVLSSVDAKLLAEALHLALEYVTDQTKPLWMRTDALVGIGVTTILLVVIVVVAGRVDG